MLFVLLMGLVFAARPTWLFPDGGDPIAFGVGDGRSLFSLGVVTVVAAVMSMFAFGMIDLVSQRPPRRQQGGYDGYDGSLQ